LKGTQKHNIEAHLSEMSLTGESRRLPPLPFFEVSAVIPILPGASLDWPPHTDRRLNRMASFQNQKTNKQKNKNSSYGDP
jgi:hypothetical protein